MPVLATWQLTHNDVKPLVPPVLVRNLRNILLLSDLGIFCG